MFDTSPILVALAASSLIWEVHPPFQGKEGTSVVQAEEVNHWNPWNRQQVLVPVASCCAPEHFFVHPFQYKPTSIASASLSTTQLSKTANTLLKKYICLFPYCFLLAADQAPVGAEWSRPLLQGIMEFLREPSSFENLRLKPVFEPCQRGIFCLGFCTFFWQGFIETLGWTSRL